MVPRSLISLLLVVPLVIGGCDRQSRAPEQANAAATVASTPSLPAGATGIIDRSHKGQAMSKLPFMDPNGKVVRLANFTGKPVLLNLWATWCAPCVAEMPTLDALALSAGDRVVVLPVSQDLEGAAKVDPFFANARFKALKPYRDPQAALSTDYEANLPTTILYDSSGKEVWRMMGSMDWTSKAAAALLAEAT